MVASNLVIKALEHHNSGRLDTAENLYRQALAADRRDFDALNLLGALLIQRGAFEEARSHLRQAVKLRPANADATLRLGVVQRALGDEIRAEQSYRKALQMAPNHADAHYNYGNLLVSQGRVDAALAAYLNAIRLEPRHAGSHFNLGELLEAYGRFEPALAHYAAYQGLNPNSDAAYAALGRTYAGLGRFGEAVAAFERAMALAPSNAAALIRLIAARRERAEWSEAAPLMARLGELAGAERLDCPALLMDIVDDPALHARAALDSAAMLPSGITAHSVRPGGRGKLRIGFVGAGLADPQNDYLPLLACLDRNRFEVHAFTWGHGESGPIAEAVTNALDRIHDLGQLSNRGAAEAIAAAGIHIAIDLAGHLEGARPGIFTRRPAPILALFGDYAGPSGIEAMTYLVAEARALPTVEADVASEVTITLPHTIFPNAGEARGDDAPSREGEGLADGVVVFACFAALRRITPELFALWCSLMRAVPGSQLWLAQADPVGMANLRRAAEASGIDPSRLVFATPATRPVHLARLRYASLVFDTLPGNDWHSVGDAMRAGVPALAVEGVSFAARRSAALLASAGLDDLVATDLADLEAKALALATDPAALKAVRTRAATANGTLPFDPAHGAALLGEAFQLMARNWRAGTPPAPFEVGGDSA